VRKAVINRKTAETSIVLSLELDGRGQFKNSTGIRFLDHMLDLVARHGAFDLAVKARGDLDVDQHHTVEDVGIALGEAVNEALGDRKGINRAGYFVMPMDETLAVAALDLSGRPHAAVKTKVKKRTVGDLQAELVADFFEGFAMGARERARQGALRPLQSSQDRGVLQGVRARAAGRLREGSPHGEDAAEHERPAVIALIDYGAGNLTSVRKALSAVGAEFRSPAAPHELAAYDAVIVPGVGHFAATQSIQGAWVTGIRAAVDRGAALLGICLGMQFLYSGSAEAPGLAGLAVLPGTCVRLPDVNVPETGDSAAMLKVPHVGWNDLVQPRASALMAGVGAQAQVYFTHSYVAPVTDATVAITTYGVPFASAVEHGRVAGVQFHPEKSGDIGLRILSNWLGMARC
jgi:imidazole glycerol phosphate synthase glutamine amidotransferase subunit